MFGFDYRVRPPERLITVEDYRQVAQGRLPKMVWSYVDGGADDLISLRDNREAFLQWSLRPRVLRGGGEVRDLSTVIAGVHLSLPVLLAPTGFTGLSHWFGDIAAARAAESQGTRYTLSTASSWSIEEVANGASVEHFFQLYPRRGDVAASLMKRAWSAGFRVMMVTVDTPTRGNREGERKHGMGIPPVLTPGRLIDISKHPSWAYNVIRHRRIAGRNLVAGGSVTAALASIEIQDRELLQATLNWDDLGWIREQWRGPLYVKGILDPGDAERAARLGFDGIVVSNHGGRQLDFAPATLLALPEIAAAVGARTEVLLDGGVRRGSDVVKALALGARAVLIGRPYIYGLAVAGERGVAHVLDILRSEISRTLTLMGVRRISDLDRSWLVPRQAQESAGLEMKADGAVPFRATRGLRVPVVEDERDD